MRYHHTLTYRRSPLQAACRHAHGQTATVESLSGSIPIYIEPSPGASTSGSAPCGACLEVLGRKAGWYAVRYRQSLGYVPGDKIVLNY